MEFRNMEGEINMHRQSGAKPNFSDIARRYGVDRHTVSRHWERSAEPAAEAEPAGSGFDPYRAVIEEKARIPGVTKRGIHEFLLDRYGDSVPGYAAMTAYMRSRGIELGAGGEAEPHPRYETEPGEQLQFDWKERVLLHGRGGEEYRFDVFSATLSWSRYRRFSRVPGMTSDDLAFELVETALFLGGVPRVWLTDNMSALVVVGADGSRRKVERCWRLAREVGFEIELCAARSPQTKGKVESANRFLSRLAAYDGEVGSWEEVDDAIARVQARSNAEPSQQTGVPPEVLFAKEKDSLAPVGSRERLEGLLGSVTRQVVPPTMLVRAAGRQWSVPRRCIGRQARVVVAPGGELRVYVGGELVAVHDTLAPGGPLVYDPAHYAEALSSKRWALAEYDGDIERAAAEGLERLSRLGGSL